MPILRATEDYSPQKAFTKPKLYMRVQLGTSHRPSERVFQLTVGIVHYMQYKVFPLRPLFIWRQQSAPPASRGLVGMRLSYTAQLVLCLELQCVSRYCHLSEGC